MIEDGHISRFSDNAPHQGVLDVREKILGLSLELDTAWTIVEEKTPIPPDP
jgi:hypothetical protein